MKLDFISRLFGGTDHGEAAVENLDDILLESMQEPEQGEVYPDDAPIASTVPGARERVLRNSHLFRDTWFALNEIPSEDKIVANHYLRELSSLVRNRGIMLTSEVLDHLVEMLDSGETTLAYWQEPWMVPFKLTRRRAIDLFEMALAHTSQQVPFERLAEHGLKHRFAKDYVELGNRLRADALAGAPLMRVFYQALSRHARATKRQDLRSICNTLDYALACMGDRTSMLRLSELLRMVAVPGADEVAGPAEARRNELAVVSDGWRRMSSVVMNRPIGDGETELAEFIAAKRMDMRNLQSYFDHAAGWILPPANIPPIPSGVDDEDWKKTLFTPHNAIKYVSPAPAGMEPDEQSRLKAAAEAMASRTTAIARIFQDEITSQKLSRTATDDTPFDDGNEVLDSLRNTLTKIRASKRCPNSILEMVVAAFSQAMQENKAVSSGYAPSLSPITNAALHPDSLSSHLKKMTDIPPASTYEKPPPATSANQFMKVLDKIGESEESGRASAAQTFGGLLNLFEMKPAGSLPDEVYLSLNREFPWMKEANEFIGRAIAWSAKTKSKAFKAAPVLLSGPAGVGKTRWARRVSEITGIPVSYSSMAGIAQTKSIIGSERGWMNARPSLPAYAFLKTGVANPIIYVDEVDKTTGWDDVTDAFLPMLEQETASSYSDIYLLGSLDLSMTNFIFTANNLNVLSQELLSRVRILNIRAPSAAEIHTVINTMVAEICADSMIEASLQQEISASLIERSSAIYLKCTNLREVKNFLLKEVEGLVWSPPGPRLIK